MTETIFFELRSYFSLVRHSPGTLKVRFNPRVAFHPHAARMRGYKLRPKGVRSTRVNPLTRSLKIYYDAGRIPPSLIDDFFSACDTVRFRSVVFDLCRHMEIELPQ